MNDAIPLRNIYLRGELGRQFGECFKLAAATPAEAVRALAAQLPGFRHTFAAGEYFVRVAGDYLREVEQVLLPTRRGDIEFVPTVEGGGGGRGKSIGLVIAGTVLLGAAVIASGGTAGGLAAAVAAGGAGGLALSAAASIGTSLILTGVTGLLAPVPKLESYEPGRERRTNSFLYQGPINRASEGGVVPLVFGRVWCGSTQVAGGTTVSSNISQGEEKIVLSSIPIGQYAFNFSYNKPSPSAYISNETDNLELHPYFRRNASTGNTFWDWEISVQYIGGDGNSLPNNEYLKFSIRFGTGEGLAFDPGFYDDWFYSHNGFRTKTFTNIRVGPGTFLRHRFSIKNTEDDLINPNSYYSRLKRRA